MNSQLENRLSSREVAEMMNIKHYNLIRKIDGINKDFTDHKIEVSKYWLESSYQDATGKTNREFQISKKGCEFLAHKTTGTKGNLFTDKYMDRFAEMEQVIKNNIPVGLAQTPIDESVVLNMNLMSQNMQIMSKSMSYIQKYVQDSIQAKDKQIEDISNLIGIRSKNKNDLIQIMKTALVKKYNLNHINANMEVYRRAKSKIFKEFTVSKWEDIPATKYNAVQAFIEECL